MRSATGEEERAGVRGELVLIAVPSWIAIIQITRLRPCASSLKLPRPKRIVRNVFPGANVYAIIGQRIKMDIGRQCGKMNWSTYG
jgi:hypothetical protein